MSGETATHTVRDGDEQAELQTLRLRYEALPEFSEPEEVEREVCLPRDSQSRIPFFFFFSSRLAS